MTTELELFRDPAEVGDKRPLRDPGRTIAIAGARGGAGASFFAANLSVFLSTSGRRVLAVDADVEASTLHTFIGVDPFVARRAGPAVVETALSGLSLLRSGLDGPLGLDLRRRARTEVRERLAILDADHLVIDLGHGTRRALLEDFLSADYSIFVTTPDPPAFENTVRFLRWAFFHHLLRQTTDAAKRRSIKQRLGALGPAPLPIDVVRRLDASGDTLGTAVREAMQTFRFRFIVNQTRTRGDLDLGSAFASVVRRRLGLEIECLGHIDHDDAARTAVLSGQPLLVASPGAKASRNLERIARRTLTQSRSTHTLARLAPAGSHHDLLDVGPGASDEEIRRAFKRAKEIYAPESLVCYGLYDEESLRSVRANLEEARDVLLDPVRRGPYELSVFEPNALRVSSVPPAPPRTGPLPEPPSLGVDTVFTGGVLRAVRESLGVDLSEIAARTKVGTGHLRAIEADDFAALPAPVYVRGFVVEFAKCLQLDTVRVSQTYLRRYQHFLDARN